MTTGQVTKEANIGYFQIVMYSSQIESIFQKVLGILKVKLSQ